MLSTALKKFSKCSLTFERRGRTLDGFGGFVRAKTESCVHKAYINFKELRKLSVSLNDAYSEDKLPLILRGNHEYLEINDTALLNSLKYRVQAVRFRPLGNFTNILIERIKRRGLTI